MYKIILLCKSNIHGSENVFVPEKDTVGNKACKKLVRRDVIIFYIIYHAKCCAQITKFISPFHCRQKPCFPEF